MIDQDIIERVTAAGFQVFMRERTDTWMFFTDGTHIGYLQDSSAGGLSISTVHIPSHNVGSGYRVEDFMSRDELTRDNLVRAFALAPSWENPNNIGRVRKWRDFEDFKSSNSWYSRLRPVAELNID